MEIFERRVQDWSPYSSENIIERDGIENLYEPFQNTLLRENRVHIHDDEALSAIGSSEVRAA